MYVKQAFQFVPITFQFMHIEEKSTHLLQLLLNVNLESFKTEHQNEVYPDNLLLMAKCVCDRLEFCSVLLLMLHSLKLQASSEHDVDP